MSPNNKMVSILMPVYNAEHFLNATIKSILEQTYSNWELIAVDDYSDDKSMAILEDYAKDDTRIRVYNSSRKGIINALQTGYRVSTGAMITRMDADDLMHQEKLALMFRQLNQAGPGHLITALIQYFSDAILGEGYKKYEKWLNGLSMAENNFSEIYKECVIPSPCWMCYRYDLDKAGAFESELYPEDYDLCFRFREAGLKIKTVGRVLHFWRDHESRTSRIDKNYADNRFIQLKVFHFLKSDFNKNKCLVLWGAGKKAKKIAQLLLENQCDFDWICENDKKAGKNIYGQIVRGAADYNFTPKNDIILAVAQVGEKEKIIKRLNSIYKSKKLNNVYAFC